MKKKFIGVIGIVIAVMVGGIYYLTRAEKMELSLKNKKEIIVEYGNTVQYSFDERNKKRNKNNRQSKK